MEGAHRRSGTHRMWVRVHPARVRWGGGCPRPDPYSFGFFVQQEGFAGRTQKCKPGLPIWNGGQ